MRSLGTALHGLDTLVPVRDDRRLSKTLAYWLRHRPDVGGLTLDAQGWVDISAILAALARSGSGCDLRHLLQVVDVNDKQRFELSSDGLRIRARQGHSVSVSLELPRRRPPDLLYHGTVERFLGAIGKQGLRPMQRHHVHLSPDMKTTRRVGSRRGAAVVLSIRAAELDARGQPFFLTSDGVWLTDAVAPAYLELI